MDEQKEKIKQEQRKQVQREIMSLSTAILAGAVIVGVAVILAANMVIDKLEASAVKNQAAAIEAGGRIAKVEKRAGAHSIGTGQVVIQEFSDFECPYCQSFWQETYGNIKKNYIDTGKVTLIYRHFPLSIHAGAQKAGEAAECAGAQGKFWEYHDLLFGQGGLASSDLERYAENLALDSAKFETCLEKGETESIVKSDIKAGLAAGVTGTPTFFINGRKLVGALDYAEFEKVIEKALVEAD